jgi:hypothetical protein
MVMLVFKILFTLLPALVLAALLTSCGGSSDFPPVITGVKVQTISYGRTATIYLGSRTCDQAWWWHGKAHVFCFAH